MLVSSYIVRRRPAKAARWSRGDRTRWRWIAAAWLGSLGCLVAVPSALAAQAATALTTKTVGPMEPGAQALLDAAVSRALREQQFLDVAAGERDAILGSEPKLAGCVNDPCLERIGRLLDSQLVVRAQATVSGSGGSAAKLAPAGTADWELSVDLFDVAIGAVGAAVHSQCPGCTTPRAAQALSELVGRAMLESASRPRGTLAITSVPANALVFIDGTELGFTPYQRKTFAGAHRIVVRSTGFRSYQGQVVVDESKKQQVTVTLQPGTDPVQVVVVEKAATPIYKKWWFWTAIGGAALLAGGITAGVILGTREVGTNGTPGLVHIHF